MRAACARATLAAIVSALAALAGCTVSLDDPAGRACDATHGCAQGRVCRSGVCSPPGAADPDAATTDAGNLDPLGTFETGCAPWQPFQGSAEPSNVARTGLGACKVCASDQPDFTLDDKGFLPSPARGRYTAHAWIRSAGGAAPPLAYGVILRTVRTESNGDLVEVEKNAGSAPVGVDWVEASATLDVTMPSDALNVVVFAKNASQGRSCVLVDDVTVEHAP